MAKIVLSTLNARYTHCAFGLRYLLANLNELANDAEILEFTISQNPKDIAEVLLAANPNILGFGVYIWNTKQTYEVVSIIKRVRPEIKIVLGGPEVSFETESQDICRIADLTIQGEGEVLFHKLCQDYFKEQKWPTSKILKPELPNIEKLALPYKLYTDSDVQNRVIYVEASRGCPYKCEYCLSSLDKSVRSFDIDLFLNEMDLLIRRGVRQFKFIDRTFNLSIPTSTRILSFFLERMHHGLFLHFEMVPDRLPTELRALIGQFPKGSLQFEIGIQTWNPEVSKLVSRRQDYSKIRENFAYLAEIGNVHTHADLIAGLPGETLESFAHGFDAVAELKPDEVQVGILKRLKGTPIIRHDQEWQMVYQEHPPFQVLQTKMMPFETIQRISRFANFWDLVANSGNFNRTMQIIKSLSASRPTPSLFWQFDEMVSFLNTRHPQGHSVALLNLVESVWIFLKDLNTIPTEDLRSALIQDYSQAQKRDIPHFLKTDEMIQAASLDRKEKNRASTPSRQMRHLSKMN